MARGSISQQEPIEVRIPMEGGGEIVLWCRRPGFYSEALIGEIARQVGPEESVLFKAKRTEALFEMVVESTLRWDGVTVGGKPAVCNRANKAAWFNDPENADAVNAVLALYLPKLAMEADRPNVSGDGSDSSSPIPASTAEKSTSTGANAPTSGAEDGGAAAF